MGNGESVDQKKLTDEELKNLAWNATDKQDHALLKLEYFLMAHYAYLHNLCQDIGELTESTAEVSGFYLTANELIRELKESSETIFQGLKANNQ